jgi:nucleoside-diphosphate-sugar epimerase
MKTLLITGSTGFIGQNMLEYIKVNFENQFKVVLLSSGVSSIYTTILHKNYTFKKDAFIEKDVEYIDIVLHIGAFTPKSGEESNDIEKSNSNIINTKFLLDNLPNIPSKFIFLSTLDVYGKIESKIDESCDTNPLSMYGWSKLYCEKMIENWAINNKITIQILRLGHIYGKGEEAYKKIIPVTITKIKSGKNPQILGTGNDKRSFLHINDVCNLIMNSISLNEYKGVLNLCSTVSYSIKEIINLLIKISQKNLDIDYIENSNSALDFTFNTAKMNQLLGYESINIKDGLRDEYYAV